jgi:arylsulfatase
VLIFIDTLRQDHLSIYGYPRDTTPNLKAWSKDAAVFDQSRSVAPWTLPSARTMLTGVVPERWMSVDALPERFARAGWTTAFIAGNTYLSSNFDIDRGWGLHRCINWPRAEIEVGRGLEFLAQHADRPAFLLVHLMDQHLPYVEPLRWRYHFAGRRPAALDADYFLRSDVMRLGRRLTEPVKQHIRDRYDNNLAYVDHELARLLAQLDIHDRDTVLLLADHGEEFWDHGGFEHGQSIHEELVHVPMVLAGPGISPARVEEPVSMLDVSPTLASAAGLPLDGMTGWPLQGAADRSRAADFAARPQAFGRPLYGQQVWGSLLGAEKYIAEQGRDRLYNLLADPTEDAVNTPDAASAARMRSAMSDALGTPALVVWRLSPGEHETGGQLMATLDVPTGIEGAWAAKDPTGGSSASVSLEGDRAIMTWQARNARPIEIYVLPKGDPTAALSAAQLTLQLGIGTIEQGRARWEEGSDPPPPDGSGAPLMSARGRGRSVTLTYATVPLPYEDSDEINAFDAEVKGELHSLGYLEDAGEEPADAPQRPRRRDGETNPDVNEGDGSAP